MAAHAFDVVTVADFTGPAARRFEIQTLFFLSSWLEYGGRSRDLPLHIACIGDPPESVRFMGGRCGAEITSHSPEPQGGFANKLRGFEVNRRTGHVLLLDSDMLVLAELNDLHDRFDRECIAAASSNAPFPASRESWPRIYKKLGIPVPKSHVVPLNLQLDTFKCVPYRDQKDFPPYYNGGVIYAPWRCELGEVWRSHLTRILRLSSRIIKPKAKASNQPSLATAIAHLQSQGFNFQLLPDEYHVRWQHLATGAVSSRTARIFHALGFARQKLDAHTVSAEEAVEVFHAIHLQRTGKVRSHRGPLSETEQRASQAQVEDCHRLHRLIKTLYEKHVRELVQ